MFKQLFQNILTKMFRIQLSYFDLTPCQMLYQLAQEYENKTFRILFKLY